MTLVLVAGLLLGLPAASAAQPEPPPPETGRYDTQNFGTNDYEAHAQNWAVVQDSTGLIYVGNGSGILEYDGVEWRAITLPTHSAVRSLAVGPEGRVYAGGQGDFGYLAPDSTGTTQYVSLLPEVDPAHTDFSAVWRTVATSDGIYFSTRERLFRWSPQDTAMTSWAPDGIFALGFAFRDAFYTVEPGKGLLRVEGDALVPAPGGDAFREDIAYFALPIEDDAVLLATRDQGLVRYDGAAITPFETEVDAALQRDLLYHGALLPDGTLALATRRGGLYLVSRNGRLLRVIDEDSGLSDAHIWYAYTDREGSLWLALNSGIARLDVSALLTFFDEAAGLPGIVMSVTRHDGRLFAATSAGVYRLSAAAGRAPRFTAMLPNTSGQCLSLLSTEAGLLAGCEGGLYVLDGASTPAAPERLTEATTRLLYRSSRTPTTTYAATREGLMRLTLRDGRWHGGDVLPDLPGWALSIAEDRAGALWLTTGEDGIARVTEPRRDDPPAAWFTTEHGLPPGWTYAAEVDSTLLFHTTEGVFQFDDAETPGRFVPDTLLGPHLPAPRDEVFLLEEDAMGNVWFSNASEIGVARPQPDGSYRATMDDMQRLPDVSFQAIYPEADGIVWFGTEDGLLRYAATGIDLPEPHAAVQIRRVSTIEGDSLLFGGAGRPPAPMRLSHTQNALRFAYALPAYDGGGAHRYQVRLEGLEDTWSAWTAETVKDYTNVPPGDYVFRVRARDPYGRLREEGRFAFRILRPWHRTWWAYLLFGLGALGLIGAGAYGGYRYRVRRLKTQNRRLEAQVQQRTETLQAANERLERVLAQNNEFLSIAAHDLKNPLTNIIGFCDVLLDEEQEASAERTEFLSLIRKSALRMRGIVRQLQDTALLESGQIDLNPAPTDLTELAAAALQRHAMRATEKGINLHLEADGPVRAHVDEPYMARVLDNLISNAIKFSPSETHVWVRLRVEGNEAVIAVQDQGPGLTEADQKHAFEKLQRLSARPTSGEASTGLGLYIVRILIELHGGTVRVESTPGEGATFVIRLAAARP